MSALKITFLLVKLIDMEKILAKIVNWYSIYIFIKPYSQSRRGAAVADVASVLKVSSSNPTIDIFFGFVSFEF